MRIRWGIRLFLLTMAAAYLAFMVASHSTPFSPDLEVPLAVAGWVPLVAGIAAPNLRPKIWRRLSPGATLRQYLAPIRRRPDIYLFAALMLVVLAAAAAAGSQGNHSGSCDSSNPANCIKIDHWTEKGGLYYRKYPYDAGGADAPNAPWVQISRTEYIAEVGTRLRSAAGFGMMSLALASFLSVAEEGVALSNRSRKREIELADDLPQPS